MTHEEACRQLTDAAYALYGDRISRGEWWDEVDRIITAVEERATSTPPEQAYAPNAWPLASRMYTTHGTRLREGARQLAADLARAAGQAGS